MNYIKIQENILRTIKYYINFKLNEFECNKTTYGVITKITDENKGIYEVKINGEEGFTCFSANNEKYEINDVVVILILNNNFSNKYIFSKMKN